MTPPQSPSCRRYRPHGAYTVIIALVLTLALFVTSQNSPKLLENDQTTTLSHRALRRIHGIFTDQQAFSNANLIKNWRSEYEKMCKDDTITIDELFDELQRISKPTMIHVGTHEDSLEMEPCRQVFLDFGANVGDSLQKFISAGIPKCSDKLPNHHPSFNATTGGASESFRGGNMLVSWSWNRMMEYSSLQLQPEDYCYFGIEGNPSFTTRLKALERSVMRMDPRPVRRAHFLTETVGAGKDGPTTLYLDTVNQEQNAWGSSLLKDHVDVAASAEQHGGSRVEAKVQGITLGTLLKHVLPTIATTQTASSQYHVMIKMDIEGGEFAIMEQAASDATVCELLKSGVRIDMIMEGHPEAITGTRTPEQQEAFQKAKDKLVKCGLNLWFVKDAGR